MGCTGNGYVGYQPPFLPIAITIDDTGNVSVVWEESIQTPIGRFFAGVSESANISDMYPEKNGVLDVNVDGTNTIYDLGGKNNISIKLESGYYSQIELKREGKNWFFAVEKNSTGIPTDIFVETPIETSTEILIETPSRDPRIVCDNSYPSFLQKGGRAHVSDAIYFYTSPYDWQQEITNYLTYKKPAAAFGVSHSLTVIDGPVCAPGPSIVYGTTVDTWWKLQDPDDPDIPDLQQGRWAVERGNYYYDLLPGNGP